MKMARTLCIVSRSLGGLIGRKPDDIALLLTVEFGELGLEFFDLRMRRGDLHDQIADRYANAGCSIHDVHAIEIGGGTTGGSVLCRCTLSVVAFMNP